MNCSKQDAKTSMPKPTSKTPKKTTKKASTTTKEMNVVSVNVAKKTETPSPAKSTAKTTTAKASKKTTATPKKEALASTPKQVLAKEKSPKTTVKTTGKITPKIKKESATLSPNPPKVEASETQSVQSLVLNELKRQLGLAGLVGMGRPPRVILAFSGGADSTALLHALSQLKSTEGLECLAVYYHHNWRGTPPPELARVHKNCQRLRIPLVFAPPHPDEEKSELSARQYRYERLLDVATQFRAEAILTAHHQDDQIETLLFRIFRGTGLDGLEGIQRCLFFRKQQEESPSHIPILRPFLDLSVSTLEAYNKVNELLYFEDPSNANTRYARNAIRHEIIPKIEAQFPTYAKSILRLAHLAEGDLSILDHITRNQWDALNLADHVPSVFQYGTKRSTTLFCQLAEAYQRRLVRHLLEELHIESHFEEVQRIIHFITQDVSSPLSKKIEHKTQKKQVKMSLGTTPEGDLRFLLRSDKAFWIEVHPKRNQAYYELIAKQVAIPLNGGVVTLPWDAGQAFRVEPFPKRAGIFDMRKLTKAKSKDVLVNVSDYAGKTIVLRTRQAGDWISPLGMKGKHMKLKAFFIAQKIPQELRAEWPVIACGDEILWVPGIGMSESLKVGMRLAPTHTWMLGGTEEVTQLRTLRFLEDPSVLEDSEEELDAMALNEEVHPEVQDGDKNLDALMIEHEELDDIEVIDLEEVLESGLVADADLSD